MYYVSIDNLVDRVFFFIENLPSFAQLQKSMKKSISKYGAKKKFTIRLFLLIDIHMVFWGVFFCFQVNCIIIKVINIMLTLIVQFTNHKDHS